MQMYGKLFRQAYGRLACLAVLSVIAMALVGCGAGPGAKAQPDDPVKIKDVVFEKVGADDVKIPLGDKFSGEGLTYTATSSNKAMATVMVDNEEDILTVTAVGAGEATITVTAADSQDRTASQTFKVTVKATTSEPEPGAPTVRTGAPGSFDVDQGDTQTVTLSRVFTGEDLEFTVASNDTDVATASEDAGILTITARSPGDATITVTATNDDGNAAHRITVTVPEPVTATSEPASTNNPSNCQSPLTIKLNEIAKCKLPPKATLRPPPPPQGEVVDVDVAVSRSADATESDVWVIRAHKKGTYTITILSGSASPERIGEITVVVPNSPPVRNTIVDPAVMSITILGIPADGETYSAALAALAALSTYFDDADEDSFRYSIGKKPDWLLINAKDGFVVTDDDAKTLTFEVLEKVTEDFQVTIYANDESDRSQLPVVLTFAADADTNARTPRVRDYDVMQTETGKWTDIPKVGPRLGVGHTLTFENSGDRTGFQFPRSKVKDLLDAKKLFVETVSEITQAADLYYVRGGKYFKVGENEGASSAPYSAWKKTVGDVTGTAVNTDLYILRSTGVVEARWPANANLNNDLKVIFELTKKGSGSITIEYHIWAGSPDGDTAPGGQSDAGNKREPVTSGILTLNIMACSSPPDPLEDCK